MKKKTKYARNLSIPVEQDAREIISQLVKNGLVDWETFWMHDERYIYIEV